jgi:hypothetical protein
MKLPSLDRPVTSAWLNLNGRRLDSSPYVSGAAEAKVLLSQLAAKTKPLQELTLGGKEGLINAGRIARTWVDDPAYGIPFLSSTDILQADLSNVSLITKKAVQLNPRLIIREGWTLITRSGSIGRMAYCRPDMSGMACTEDVLRVVPDPNKILPGYLYAYLSSRFGVPQVIGGTYGTIIQHIEQHHIEDLPVPIAPGEVQLKVHKLIQEMASLRAEGIAAYRKATTSIFDSLGIEDPPRHKWLSDNRKLAFFVTTVSPITFRASSYDPRYLELCSLLQQHQYSKLGELCDPQHFKSGIVFRRIDAEGEFAVRLIGQREAFQIRPEGRWISRKSIEGLGLIVPPGTTMIAAHGTLGETELYCRSTYVIERTAQYAFSGDFVRCIPLDGKILPGYLFAFLRSEAAFRILRCISVGSKQQAHHPYLLWHIPVPRMGAEKEQEIHALVEAGAQALDRSLQLEEDAWHAVEGWIMEEGRN